MLRHAVYWSAASSPQRARAFRRSWVLLPVNRRGRRYER